MDTLRNELLDSITGIYGQCNVPNWDEEGAIQIPAQAWINAGKLVNSLPQFSVQGTAFPTKNGKIGLNWAQGKNKALSMLIDGYGRVTYAVILPDGRVRHGIDYFDGTAPSDVREMFFQLTSKPAVPAKSSESR